MELSCTDRLAHFASFLHGLMRNLVEATDTRSFDVGCDGAETAMLAYGYRVDRSSHNETLKLYAFFAKSNSQLVLGNNSVQIVSYFEK